MARGLLAHAPLDALLLDFGNVVVPIDFGRMLAAWSAASGVAERELARRFAFDAAYRAHERGEMTTGDYFDHLRATLGVRLDDAELAAGWNAIFLEADAAMPALLDDLAARYPLYLFSNTNRAHHDCWASRYAALLSRFAGVITSCELGARKPEVEAFRRVAERIGAAPARIAFFDDLEENVAGAIRAGFQAFVATGPDDIRRALP